MTDVTNNNWKAHKLNELGVVRRGRSRHRPRNEPSLYGGPYPFFQTGDIKAANLYLSKYSQTYSEKGLAQSKLWKPGTLCITIAANIAETAILAVEGCFPDSVVGFVANPKKADARFIKYAIDQMKLRMQNISRGTTQDNLSVDKLLTFDFLVPDIDRQSEVAGVISAYDELIENNTRRIKILEDMAQALYREWFVHLRFLGHENITLVESRLGKIPKGWEVRQSTEAICVNPQTPVSKNELKPHVSMESLATNSMLIGEVTMRTGNSGSKFMNGDTLFARITPCLENGKTAFVNFLPSDSDVAIGSTEFIVLRSKTLCPEYVYLLARSNEFRDNAIKSMSGATGRQRVQEKCFEKFLIAQPDEITLRQFHSLTKPMFKSIHVLADKNRNLRRTRDLLLPKLISGEIKLTSPQ